MRGQTQLSVLCRGTLSSARALGISPTHASGKGRVKFSELLPVSPSRGGLE